MSFMSYWMITMAMTMVWVPALVMGYFIYKDKKDKCKGDKK